MKLIAIETSSNICGACICEDDKLIDKIEIDNGLTHSQNLMPLIKELLNRNNTSISNIEGFVCDIGPGSFTGIRIGVATAKAFVDTKNTALYTGVSSLEALAYNIKDNGYIASVIDCKNNNCYYSLYKLENMEYKEIIAPTASSICEMIENVSIIANNITFVGDGAFNYKNDIISNIPNSIISDENLNIIKIQNLALAGFKKINNNSTLELTPLYLKKPQAERLLEEKTKKDA